MIKYFTTPSGVEIYGPEFIYKNSFTYENGIYSLAFGPEVKPVGRPWPDGVLSASVHAGGPDFFYIIYESIPENLKVNIDEYGEYIEGDSGSCKIISQEVLDNTIAYFQSKGGEYLTNTNDRPSGESRTRLIILDRVGGIIVNEDKTKADVSGFGSVVEAESLSKIFSYLQI